MDLSTNIKFKHIIAQEDQANNIKAINHGKKQGNMLERKIKQEHTRKSNKAYY